MNGDQHRPQTSKTGSYGSAPSVFGTGSACWSAATRNFAQLPFVCAAWGRSGGPGLGSAVPYRALRRRAVQRDLLRSGPGRAARLLRELLDAELVPDLEASHVVQVVYEFAGTEVLERLLAARLAERTLRTWRRVAQLGAGEVEGTGTRFVMEPDLVAGITHGQLGFGEATDGLPLDPQALFALHAADVPPFTGEPVDLPAALPHFSWPTAVVSGERDLRTPRPIAERIVQLVPRAVLVPLPDLGHSALDTHQLAALNVAHVVAAGGLAQLPDLTGRIAALPRRGASGKLGSMIRTALAVDLALPGGRPGRSPLSS